MSVMCSMCGKQTQDHEFCDHCNADLGKTGQNLPPEICPLDGAGVPLTSEQRHLLLFPESSIAINTEGRSWRVHWISSYDWRERGPQLEKRMTLQIAPLPIGRFVDDPLGRWLIFDKAPAAEPPWKQPVLADPLAELQRLSACLHSIAHALEACIRILSSG